MWKLQLLCASSFVKGRQDILRQIYRDSTPAQLEMFAIDSFEYLFSIFPSKFSSFSSSSESRIPYERRLELVQERYYSHGNKARGIESKASELCCTHDLLSYNIRVLAEPCASF